MFQDEKRSLLALLGAGVLALSGSTAAYAGTDPFLAACKEGV